MTFPNKSPWQLMLLAQNWAWMHSWDESLNCCLGLRESLSCSAWGCFTLIESNKALFCLLEEKQGSKSTVMLLQQPCFGHSTHT